MTAHVDSTLAWIDSLLSFGVDQAQVRSEFGDDLVDRVVAVNSGTTVEAIRAERAAVRAWREGFDKTAGDLEVHIVVGAQDGNRVARCGFDCSGRERRPEPGAVPTCVVCLELSRSAGSGR